MAKPHSGAELEQAGLGCRRGGVGPDREPLGGSPHEQRVADGIGRRELQQAPGRDRKRVEPSPEALLDPARERHRAREREPARQLRRRESTRQLQQRQRVAARLADDLVADLRVHGPGEHGVQQRVRIVLRQTLHVQLGQPRQLVARRTRREDQADRFRLQAARDEREDLCRGAIEPLCVVHHADQRLLLGRVGQQAQDRESDEEAVRRRPGTEAERGPQRIALRHRETLETIEHRRQQLMQPGEGQLHLRLDAGGAYHTAAGRLLDEVVQQRRLAHARLAPQHQGPALARADRFDEPVEHVALAAPAPELTGASLHEGMRRHLPATDVTPRADRPRRLATGGCERAPAASPWAHDRDSRNDPRI